MGKIPLATKMSTPHNIIFYLFYNYSILQKKNLRLVTCRFAGAGCKTLVAAAKCQKRVFNDAQFFAPFQ